MNAKILIVDDEKDLRELLSMNLENEGFNIIPNAKASHTLIQTLLFFTNTSTTLQKSQKKMEY